jgi:hypothetical protein
VTKAQLHSRLDAARNVLRAIRADVRRALPAKAGAIDWRIALEDIDARAAAALEAIK